MLNPVLDKWITSMREALRINDGLTFEQDLAAKGCWDVMSALRGPDQVSFIDGQARRISGDTVKEATTAVIRYKVFGLGSAVWQRHHLDKNLHVPVSGLLLLVGPDNSDKCEVRKNLSEAIKVWGDNHFILHARNAFAALDLSWEEVNTQET
jgi:hypothetical protein